MTENLSSSLKAGLLEFSQVTQEDGFCSDATHTEALVALSMLVKKKSTDHKFK